MPELCIAIEDHPEQLRARLRQELLPVRSLWLPSRKELDAWSHSAAPLYVRFVGPQRIEIGPRTYSVQTACLCPVWRGELRAGSAGGELRLHRGLPRLTALMAATWLAVELVWAAVGLPEVLAGELHPSWLLWWGIPWIGGAAALGLGWWRGGQQLDAARPELERIARAPVVAEDW